MSADEASSLVDFAALLASRAGCGDVLDIGGVRGRQPQHVEGVVVHDVSPSAVTRGPWVLRRAPTTGVLLSLDGLLHDVAGDEARDRLRAAGAILREAPYSVVHADPEVFAAHRPTLAEAGVEPAFVGGVSHGAEAGAAVAVYEGGATSVPPTAVPADFSAVAFVTVFNEDDVLEPVLDDLADQGVQAYVLDNWSTDDSWSIVQERVGRGVVGAERWPAEGRADFFDLKASLLRVEELTRELDADWYIKHDADEIRRAPWPDTTLREAMWRVQEAGYNVIDFTVMNYQPVDNGYRRGENPWDYFEHFEFGSKPGFFRQFKAWRNFGQDIRYAGSGSHQIRFAGVRVFPYKFELHHYPLRSQDHGLRKVLNERQTRYLPEARARGWHRQYDHIGEGTNLLRDPAGLLRRSERTWDEHLVERLSGAGLMRDALPRGGQAQAGSR